MSRWQEPGSTFDPEPSFEVFPVRDWGRRKASPPIPKGFVPEHLKGDLEKNKRCGVKNKKK